MTKMNETEVVDEETFTTIAQEPDAVVTVDDQSFYVNVKIGGATTEEMQDVTIVRAKNWPWPRHVNRQELQLRYAPVMAVALSAEPDFVYVINGLTSRANAVHLQGFLARLGNTIRQKKGYLMLTSIQKANGTWSLAFELTKPSREFELVEAITASDK